MPFGSRWPPWLPLAGLALTTLIWASNSIVAKVILREASPIMVSLLRFTLAGSLFYLPAFIALHRGPRRFSGAEWLRIIPLGIVGTTGSMVLNLLGLQTTPAIEAGIYQITMPLFVFIFAWLWLGEQIRRSRLIGIGLAALGALMLVSGGQITGLGGDLVGAAFMLASNLAWAGYTLLSKELLARRPPLLVVAAANVVAGLAIWPIAAIMGTLAELPSLAHWSLTSWAVVAYLVAFMSTSSQWIYLRCLREVRASQASAFMYLQPLFTAAMAAMFLGELPTPLAILAGLLTLLGVWLVNRPQRGARRGAPRREIRAKSTLH